jgi:hypothetical protein
MAGLSLTELRKRPGRVEVFVGKLATKTAFDMVTGPPQKFTSLSYSSSGKVVEITPSKSKAEAEKAIQYLKSGAGSSDKISLVGVSGNVSLSKLLKSGDFGGTGGSSSGNAVKGNRGDMAEGLFAAAVTARFMNKNSPISAVHVIALIDRIDNTKMQQKMVYESPNKNPKISDKVTFQLGLALSNLVALTDKSVQSSLSDIIQSSVRYANSAIITSWSKLLYENNKYNEIEVIADGIGDQTGTKVDVRVKIDGKATDINVSLKADDVKQFGQVSGSAFEVQQKLWDKLLKLDVSAYETKYYDKIKKKDVFGALNEVYAGVTKEFNTMIKSNKKKTYATLADGINYFATLREENVTLVQLTKNEAQVYKFDNLEKLIANQTITARLLTTKATPEIVFENEKDEILVSIRIKTENKPNGVYVRNYVEKGKLLSKLASFIAT